MKSECTVSAIGVEKADCKRQDAEQLKQYTGRFGVPTVVMTLVIVVAVLITGLS